MLAADWPVGAIKGLVGQNVSYIPMHICCVATVVESYR